MRCFFSEARYRTLPCIHGDATFAVSMRIDCSPKRKLIFAVILGVICSGMLLAETHGILGHTHSIPSPTTKSHEFNIPSGPRIIAVGQDSDDPSCSLCYCFRLLGHSIVPQAYCILDSPFAIQAVLIHHLSLTQTSTLRAGSRSPPQA